MLSTIATILGHGSGGDEILLIVAPLAVVGFGLWALNSWGKRPGTDDEKTSAER
jgi:hypothetical protein